MAFVSQLLVLAHVISAIMLAGGLFGRELTRIQAAKTTDIDLFTAFIEHSGRFESMLVIPGSNLLLISGIIIAILRGWPLFGFLQGAPSNWLLVSFILTLSMIPLITLIFLPRGKVFGKRWDEAKATGVVTPELLATLHDPVVRQAHIAEAVIVGIVLFLMVMKPF